MKTIYDYTIDFIVFSAIGMVFFAVIYGLALAGLEQGVF